jgi:eukaryotic-like serine/threonine-protein kinase
MALTAGTKLGPYEIQSPLGAGGMGEVYRARDTRLERTVAIKILPTHLSDNSEFKQRFEREARAISSLSHPHICHLYDVGCHDGTDFLVMEFLDGETLADRLHKGLMPLPAVLKIGMQITEALEAAHEAGIVHRDLKPGNIMLTPSGAKLMDFGLAKPTLAAPHAPSALLLSAARTISAASPLTPLTTAAVWLELSNICRRSRLKAKRRIRGPISSPSARCSMRWQRATVRLRGRTRSASLRQFWKRIPKPSAKLSH